VAILARLLLENAGERLSSLDMRGYRLYKTSRDPWGLFQLLPLNEQEQPRMRLSLYWKYFFGLSLGFLPPVCRENLEEAAAALRAHRLAPAARKAGRNLLRHLAQTARGRGQRDLERENFWMSFPPLARPLGSYVQLLLQNGDFSPAALSKAVELTENFLASLAEE
jgi:hypothetical protein